MLTSNTAYNAVIDETNQNKKVITIEQTNKKELITKRRFQELDKEAPITNKQSKKRKVHSESQVEVFQQVRDHLYAPGVKI